MLLNKLKEVALSVAPVVGIVLILQLILYVTHSGNHIEWDSFFRFLFGSVILVTGLTILLFGLELSINKVGEESGLALIRTRNLGIILTVAGLLGFFVAVAEPDLLILASQANDFSQGLLNTYLIIFSIAVGVGLMMILSFLRAIFKWKIRPILLTLYGIIFVLTIILEIRSNGNLFPIAFDSSASVTGAVAVPFILALGIGVSRGDKNAKEEDSFGMVGITSAGTIIGISVYLLSRSHLDFPLVEIKPDEFNSVFKPFLTEIPTYLWQAALALVPFIILYFIINFTILKDSKRDLVSKVKGFIYVFIGLLLFLLSANVGYIGAARELGHNMAELGIVPVAITGFFIGSLVILAESSVHVLTDQIYNVTSGSLKKAPVLTALSIGVGLSILIMVFRTYFDWLTLPMLILPLYAAALILSFFTPNLFVALAFDSGATSSGPMAATFILGFVQGVAIYFGGVTATLGDVFGAMAAVTVVPILSIQVLGIIYNHKLKKGAVQNA
ncbi:MAG: DUF1538 domain-containing protein [Acholeplasmataceae bacterium]|jgi:hypothetical protein